MNHIYIRDAWYVAAWADDLGDGAILRRVIMNEPVAIYRSDDGRVLALQDRCIHRGMQLSMGVCVGASLRCPYHGFVFDESGACTHIPGKDVVPAGLAVRRYAVVQRQSWIWLWMGDADAADESLIPESWSLDDPALVTRHGQVDYDAYYELVNDNLTDLSHLAYVHSKSFGAGDEWAKPQDSLTELPRGIRLGRWTLPTAGSNMAGAQFETWQNYDYLVPGVLLMTNYMFAPGTAARAGLGPPLDQALFKNHSWQAVTPMTDRTTRYFFGIAILAQSGGEPIADGAKAMVDLAFEEDRITIEAQQRNLQLTGDHMKLAGHDSAPLLFRRVLGRLARQATAPPGAPGDAPIDEIDARLPA